MKEIMNELDKLSKQRVSELQKAKKNGKKVIQYTGNFIPEELIKAAGAEPYLMCRGGEPEPTDAVLGDMLRFMNPLARSLAGFYELGLDPITPISDLIVTQQTDNHIGRISELLEYKGLPVWKIGIPAEWKRDIAFDYYVNSLNKFREKLELLVGKPVDDKKFEELLNKSNKLNEAFRKIDSLRKKDNPPIGLNEFIRLIHYSYTVDADIMIDKLNELYEELKDVQGKFPEGSPRILIVGRAIAIGDYMVPKLVEESGAVIVTEFLDEGMREYKYDVNLKGDTMVDFARARYLEKQPINIFQPAWKERFEHMKQLIDEYKVDGVIWYQLSFDEIYDMEYTCLAKFMSEINMPIIKMETSYEYSREAMAPLTTRIESYVESLKGGK